MLYIEGHGAKSNIAVKCLTESEIRQLTGSEINPGVEKASCYTVVFVSSDSSSISKAITAYTTAESELNDEVSGFLTGGQAPPSTNKGADIAKKLVTEAISTDPKTVTANAINLSKNLDQATKSEVKSTLLEISGKTKDPDEKARVDALVEGIQ